MTAANLESVLLPAKEGGYAVAGLVILGWEDAIAGVAAAEATGIPIILQAGPACRKHTPVPVLGKMFRHLAESADIPVVCHIDHAFNLDECREGIDCGFTSVMFDGSSLPISENVERTARIVEIAHNHDVSVEGEVGYVGYQEGARSQVTVPDEAKIFADESGVDAMAISIGNIHLKTHQDAILDFHSLAAIEANVPDMPLVIHGGSGISREDRQTLAKTNVSKFNIGTELRREFGEALRNSLSSQPEEFDRISLLQPTIPVMQQKISEVITQLRYPDQN